MERRMTERKAFALPVEYDLGAIAGEAAEFHSAQAQDICAGGLGIITDHPLKKGAVLRLGLPVSGPRALLPVFAEVAWAVPAADRFHAGLRFLR